MTVADLVQTAENFIICEKSVIMIFSINQPNIFWYVVEFLMMFMVQTAENFIICEKNVNMIYSNISWHVVEVLLMFIVIEKIGYKLILSYNVVINI